MDEETFHFLNSPHFKKIYENIDKFITKSFSNHGTVYFIIIFCNTSTVDHRWYISICKGAKIINSIME